MKAAVSIATTSSPSPHLASKIRKERWTSWDSKIRAPKSRAELYRERARLNLGGPSDDDRESTYAVMIGEMPKKEEEEDLYSLLNLCIDFGEAAKNDAVSVPAPTVSIPSPSAPVSESVDHNITAASVGNSGVPSLSSSKMEMDMELGMTLDDIVLA